MLIAVLASILIAQDASQVEPAARRGDARAAEAVRERDRVVCRRERVLGSNRPQRTCLTESEWQQARDTAREATERLGQAQPRPLGAPPV